MDSSIGNDDEKKIELFSLDLMKNTASFPEKYLPSKIGCQDPPENEIKNKHGTK